MEIVRSGIDGRNRHLFRWEKGVGNSAPRSSFLEAIFGLWAVFPPLFREPDSRLQDLVGLAGRGGSCIPTVWGGCDIEQKLVVEEHVGQNDFGDRRLPRRVAACLALSLSLCLPLSLVPLPLPACPSLSF